MADQKSNEKSVANIDVVDTASPSKAATARKRTPESMVHDFSQNLPPQPNIDKAETLIEFIHAPNKLKKKVGDGATSFDPVVFIKAVEAVKTLSSSYIDTIAPKELKDIQTTFQALQFIPERVPEFLAKLYTQAQDMKASGGSYGYPLLSRVSESLCNLTDGLTAVEPNDLTLMKFHIDSLSIIIRKRIKGSGGEIGQLLAEGLEIIVAKHKAHDPSLVMENLTKFMDKLDS